ncbi:protein kinase domain-containing protein [Bacillus cereus]|uniref:protein kinase domain-containing protein n=1 Tax=Bacillus cereus TaxID=1396 RepID=UPI0039C4BC34
MRYSNYKRIKQLGEGGNGRVFLMQDDSKEKFAVKILKNKDRSKSKIERFKTEAIKVHKLFKEGQKGIIPVLDYKLPCEETGDYYFVMPIAVPLEEKIKECNNIYDLIDIFKSLATTLSELHSKAIAHRDIKPENILYYQDEYCFGDFGLIDFPEKKGITRDNEPIGNRKTMAPEMRTPSLVSDSRPADVYSFAKTLWIILTGEVFAFDGQFNCFENNKLQNKYETIHFVELYQLLMDSTAENPEKRPTIEKFLNRLIAWEEISKDNTKVDKSRWRFIEQHVIHQKYPSTLIWRDKIQVVDILKQLSIVNFNHTFIHDGGGMDSIGIEIFDDIEKDMVMLNFGPNMSQVFKIKRLIWELPNEDPEFSYFRLEFEKLNPIYPDSIAEQEKMIKEYLNDFRVLASEDLIINNNKGYEPYREDDEQALFSIKRWFNGSFLIVPKGSIYNQISTTYDGRHSEFNADDFREYMELLQYVYNHEKLKPYFWDIAHHNPFEDGLFEKLKKIRAMTDGELESNIQDDGVFLLP